MTFAYKRSHELYFLPAACHIQGYKQLSCMLISTGGLDTSETTFQSETQTKCWHKYCGKTQIIKAKVIEINPGCPTEHLPGYLCALTDSH